jgi:hypothetical protein
MESGEILYYTRYVDDTQIIYDQNKTNEDSTTNYMNIIHKYLEFTLREEEKLQQKLLGPLHSQTR